MRSPLVTSYVLASIVLTSTFAHAQITISVDLAPPPLPVYTQPAIPDDGYLWSPGYWGWDASNNDYYWVPGTWVASPFVGALWTPGYWGYDGTNYGWNSGYWGDHVGYYGGVNYGFGYTGNGYQGGRWDNGQFTYNRFANNMGSVHVAQSYSTRFNAPQTSHVSYNGGKGGLTVAPTAIQKTERSQVHNNVTAQQAQHEADARTRPDLHLSANHGAPKIAATPRASAFGTPGIEAAKNQPIKVARATAPVKPAEQARQQPTPAAHEEHQAPPENRPAPVEMRPAAQESRPVPRAEPAPRQAERPAKENEEAHKE